MAKVARFGVRCSPDESLNKYDIHADAVNDASDSNKSESSTLSGVLGLLDFKRVLIHILSKSSTCFLSLCF